MYIVLYFTFANKNFKMDSQFSVYQCGKCGVTFSRREELDAHNTREHAYWGGYQCGICGQEFIKRADIDYHKALQH